MVPETMILRFRDLSTNRGETIERHQAKIQEHGFAWWGWWNKAGETIPGDTFRALMSAIESTGYLKVFLFDTGTATVYTAQLTDIKWDPRFREIASPEPAATPEYYAGRKFKAWYRLSEIGGASVDQAALRRWSYVDVAEVFEAKRSIFQDFDSKQVSSFEELKHQERTIWFVRPFQSGDEVREILLYDTGRIKPSNFPDNIIESPSPRLLWLSDLHFSQNHHAFPLAQEAQAGNKLGETIRRDLATLGYQDVGGILITGDLTWKGSAEEFALVRAFLTDIMSWATLSPSQILLCPGNHDIAYSTEPWEKGKVIPKAPAGSKQEFERFYSELFSVAPNEYLAAGRRFLLGRSFVVELAALNSSQLRQTENVFQGHGYIGDGQRTLVAEEMNWHEHDVASPGPFRIVLLHHHVVPIIPAELAVYEQQSSTVYDAGALCNWLVKHRVNLVLHGHMHHTKVVREARSLGLAHGNTQWQEFVIAALGSTGVDLSHNQLDHRNVYGLLEFAGPEVRLRIREIHPRDPDRSADPTIVDVRIPYGS
jgi:predicted phosphohydrolase